MYPIRWISTIALALIAILSAAQAACPDQAADFMECPALASYDLDCNDQHAEAPCRDDEAQIPNEGLWGKVYQQGSFVQERAGTQEICYVTFQCTWDDGVCFADNATVDYEYRRLNITQSCGS